mgnify:FL=1
MPTMMRDAAISFPLLGDWSINPSASFTLFGRTFYWYGVIIAVGFILAMLYCARHCRRCGIQPDTLYDFLIWMIPIAIIGARLYYVIFQWGDYREHPIDALKIWEGGLAIYGGVIAGLLTGIVWCRKKKIPFGAMADVCAPGLLIGQCIGRWGNFLNREAFGAETTLPWRMQLTTTAGELVEVHPTFLYESLWNVIGLLLIVFVVSKARRFDGENTCFYFLWYGVGRFWIEGLRTDSLYLFDWTIAGQPIRVSQVLSLVLMIAALAVLFYNIRLHPHKPEELYVNIVAAREAAQAEEPAEAPETAEPAEAPEAAEPVEAPEAPEVPEESSEE